MLVALMKAMKPKILESFKDYNAQKEFLAKLKKNKNVLVVLKSDKNILKQIECNSIINYINKGKTIIVYKFKSNIKI